MTKVCQSLAKQTVVFVDADNTLWDTDSVFATAQLAVLAGVEDALGLSAPAADRLAFVREIDQSLAERHHAGLRYPPRLLAKALALAMRGGHPNAAARRAWRSEAGGLGNDDVVRLEELFIAGTRTIPALRPGVREGLEKLRDLSVTVFVLTEGPRERVFHIAEAHKINELFDQVVEAPKFRKFFERVLRLVGSAGQAFMVGDQLERDIRPAKPKFSLAKTTSD